MARLVIAFGGNALIREDERGTWPEQTVHALEAARAIARMGRADEVVLTHGNGPQVGALALQQAIGEPHAPGAAARRPRRDDPGRDRLPAPAGAHRRRPLAADRDRAHARARGRRRPRLRGRADEADRRLPRRGRGAARGPRARLARGARRRARLAAHGPQPAAAADPRGRPRAPAGRGRGARHRRRRRRHPGAPGATGTSSGSTRSSTRTAARPSWPCRCRPTCSCSSRACRAWRSASGRRPRARRCGSRVTDALRHLEEGEFPAGSMGPKIEGAARFVERRRQRRDHRRRAPGHRGARPPRHLDRARPRRRPRSSRSRRRWRHELAGPHAARPLRRQRAAHGHRACAARPRGRGGVRGRHGHAGQPQRAGGAGGQRRGAARRRRRRRRRRGRAWATRCWPRCSGCWPGAAQPRRQAIASRRGRARWPRPTPANVALVSVPGEYATLEAHRALTRGLHVFLFSDHVSLDDEIALKRRGAERGLLVMGPECGTAMLAGVGLGFANVVRPGPVGVVAAAGTGAQEVACLIDAAGSGVSHIIGVGGRDLSTAVGGTMVRQGLAMLARDEQTETLLLVAKEPEALDALAGAVPDGHARRGRARGLGRRPRRLGGAPARSRRAALRRGRRRAARRRARGAGAPRARPRPLLRRLAGPRGVRRARAAARRRRDRARGRRRATATSSSTSGPSATRRDARTRWSTSASAWSCSRPPPATAARPASCSTSSAATARTPIRPPSWRRAVARVAASAAVVARVCGTDADPQDASRQAAALRAAGAVVAPSNAAAARLAARAIA